MLQCKRTNTSPTRWCIARSCTDHLVHTFSPCFYGVLERTKWLVQFCALHHLVGAWVCDVHHDWVDLS